MKRYVSTLVVVTSFGLAQIASAATQTTNFQVSAQVGTTCTISVLPLAFGNYDPTSVAPLNGSTTITLTCTGGTPYTIDLDEGQNKTGSSSPTVPARTMFDGTNNLNYFLYSDPTLLTTWGAGAGAPATANATGTAQSITIYGQIPATQVVGSGTYTDQVVATVNF